MNQNSPDKTESANRVRSSERLCVNSFSDHRIRRLILTKLFITKIRSLPKLSAGVFTQPRDVLGHIASIYRMVFGRCLALCQILRVLFLVVSRRLLARREPLDEVSDLRIQSLYLRGLLLHRGAKILYLRFRIWWVCAWHKFMWGDELWPNLVLTNTDVALLE